MRYKYKEGCLGGSFGPFHYGHEHFLGEAFKQCYFIRIGLTDDVFIKEELKKKHPERIESFEKRDKGIRERLDNSGFSGRYEIVHLRDFYDPWLLTQECPIEVIFVTPETKKTADSLNQEREKLRIEPLKVEVIDMIPAHDFKPISSTRIRGEEIDFYGAKKTESRVSREISKR